MGNLVVLRPAPAVDEHFSWRRWEDEPVAAINPNVSMFVGLLPVLQITAGRVLTLLPHDKPIKLPEGMCHDLALMLAGDYRFESQGDKPDDEG